LFVVDSLFQEFFKKLKIFSAKILKCFLAGTQAKTFSKNQASSSFFIAVPCSVLFIKTSSSIFSVVK
jgi:hypothetical protein